MNLEPGSRDYALMGACLRIVGNLFPVVGDESLFSAARCIETSKTLMDLLRTQGLPAFVMPVDIHVSNPAWYHAAQEGVPPDDRPGWSLGVIADADPRKNMNYETRGWNGHMLVRVGRRWIMDANSYQMHRPGKIHMPRCWQWPYPEEWRGVKGVSDWVTIFMRTLDTHFEDGQRIPKELAIIQVRQRPDNVVYMKSGAWNSPTTALVEMGQEILELLQAGSLPDVIVLNEYAVDVTTLKRRWEEQS